MMNNEKAINKIKSRSENRKISSIKFKLLTKIIPFVSLVMILILFVISIIVKDILTQSANNLLSSESKSNVNEIEVWIEGILSSLNSVHKVMETVDFKSSEEELNYLYTTKELNENYPKGIYGGDNLGNYIDADNWIPEKDYVITDRDWYKEGLNHSEFTFGNPYIDGDTGEYVVSATVLLNKSGEAKKVLSTDVFLKAISDYISNIKVMGSGMSLLIDKSNGTILAHQESSKVASKITQSDSDEFLSGIAEIINLEKQDISLVDSDKGKYFVIAEPINKTNWTLVSCALEKDVMSELRSTQIKLIIISIVTVAILAIVVARSIHVIVNPIKGLTSGILKIAEGDFTVQIDSKGNDEISIMSEALEKFISNMRKIMTDIINISEKLSLQSEKSGVVSSTLYNLADSQGMSMKELNFTVDELSRSITEIAENATTLASVVSDTDSDGKKVDEKMVRTVQVSEKGKEDMNHVKKAMNNIEESMKKLEKTVEEVGISTSEIYGIINLIGDISSQTNLLALNAAIEAARAGEYGKGFAVVADEVRKLAENSSKAVEQINGLISNIGFKVNETIDKTKESVRSISSNTKLVDTACETFDSIYENINEANDIVRNMIEKINNVDQVASNMAAITEEQSAGAQEILATSETLVEHARNVTENSEKVAKAADELGETAESLERHMVQFKIK